MRRWFIIFMLFLLPIRGLVGDAMAYSMLPTVAYSMLPTAGSVMGAGVQTAINSEANKDLNTLATSTFDHNKSAQSISKPPCHMETAATDDAGTQQSQCTTCQACNLSAAIPLLLPQGILHTTAAAPTQRTAHWISAEPRLLAKTPVL